MQAKFQSNEVQCDSVENIEMVQYLEAQNVQKYFDYKIEKPKNNSFQTIELLKKKQTSLNERLTKMFQQNEEQNKQMQENIKDKSPSSYMIKEGQSRDLKQKDQHQKVDISPNSYHLDYIKSNQNITNQRFSPLKPSNKINIINSQKSLTTSKKDTNQITNYNYMNMKDQFKENNKSDLQSERLSSKTDQIINKDQKTKNLFNSRYSNQHQILTIILEVPTGVDKLIIENEDEVPEKAKNFCIKHNYSLDCVPQLIVQINQQIQRLIEQNSSQINDITNKNDSQYQQNNSHRMDQLPSFQDSIFDKQNQNQGDQQLKDQNQNVYNQRYELSQCKKNLFAEQENLQVKNKEKLANEKQNNQNEEQKKPFYNIYDSHEEALSELYNRKQQEMKSLFKLEKSNKNIQQEQVSNQSFNLSESHINNQSLSSKKTTKKWKRDVSPNQVQNFQQQNIINNESQVEQRSISPLLDKNYTYPCKSDNLEEGSPQKALNTQLKKENSQSNLMKNLRDQVKLQKAESSANLNKQQESKIQDLIDTNNLQNMRKNELIGTVKQHESNEKSDFAFINSPNIKQNNSQAYDSNLKYHKSNSLVHQMSQNSSCNDQFYNNLNSGNKNIQIVSSSGIKKSNSALLMNKGQIQPIEEMTFQQIKPAEEIKKKRSISPFNNSNIQQINNKNYFKNTVSQQNKVNDKSKELQTRSRSPIQTSKSNRSISNTRKKSVENNNNNANISKSKVITCNSSNLINQSKEKPTVEDEKQKNKETKLITPIKSLAKTPSQNKFSRSKTPTKDQQNNQKTIKENKQNQATTNHQNDENENHFQPQISEQSKKIAEASRQKGIGIHERLYNQAKKELKKKEQWDQQLKKILNKNLTPNSKKESAPTNNQLAYFQLKSIHNNGKVPSKNKDYVIYQNNISPFKPKEPQFIKGKKRDISSERDEIKSSSLIKYNKCNSQGLLLHGKEHIQDKSIKNESILVEDKQPQKQIEKKNQGENEQLDDQQIIKQQQELLSFYQNMSDKYLKTSQNEKQNQGKLNQSKELQSENEIQIKTLSEGLVFQKKISADHEKEPVKVQQRYQTYDNDDEQENALEKLSQYSQDSQRRTSQTSQTQNRLETQLFQNQLKQLQLQEEMKNHFMPQNQSVESIYPNQEQSNPLNPIQLNSNQSFTQIKKQEQGDEKLKKVLEYIFFALDSDSDGQISTENIDLSKLNTTILMIIQDVLIDVENLGGFVDLDCFCSLVKRRKVEQQLLDYVFNDTSLSYSPNNQEIQLSTHTSKYNTRQGNNNSNNINGVDTSQKQEYFNEYEKQAVEFLSKNSQENDTILSGVLLTNESITPEIFFEKKKEYFDVQEYEKKLIELQQKSNFYDLNFENREDQHQISSRYQNFIENEQKYLKNSSSPAFGNDSIYKIKN